jgi:hypothetical protein
MLVVRASFTSCAPADPEGLPDRFTTVFIPASLCQFELNPGYVLKLLVRAPHAR